MAAGLLASRVGPFDTALVNPHSSLGDDIGRHGTGGRQQCLAGREVVHERRGTCGVELAEHVVEQQYRDSTCEGADDLVPREPQRERERALLTLRGLMTGIEPGDRETPFVTMRADEGEPTVDLCAPPGRDRAA